MNSKIGRAMSAGLWLSATLSLLAGCGGSQTTSTLAMMPQTPAGSASGSRRGSWMAPDAKHQDLLYISDLATSDVYVYAYRSGALEGTLTGFSAPHGECVDAAGDVFITNTNAASVLEYAHGGSSPIATIQDPNQSPAGCSIDPTTGTLAVTSVGGTQGSSPGNVAVYKNAKGAPKIYSNASFYSYVKCTFDATGNLFVDGTAHTGNFEFAELPAGGKTLGTVTLSQSIQIAGAVQWDGKHVAVEDQGVASQGSTIYRFAISAGNGRKVGTASLGGSTDVIQPWINGMTVVGGDATGAIFYWHYPAGGAAYKTMPGVAAPVGATVSVGS